MTQPSSQPNQQSYVKQWKKSRVVQRILQDVEADIQDETVIHMILDHKISHDPGGDAPTVGQRAADKLAAFAGSWAFLLVFVTVLMGWMAVNAILALTAFDPYPFILLNLVLSCVAAIQAPILMMSQNRQCQKDRKRAENDYQVNLKTEFIIEDLHHKLDQLLQNQETLFHLLESQQPDPEAQTRGETHEGHKHTAP